MSAVQTCVRASDTRAAPAATKFILSLHGGCALCPSPWALQLPSWVAVGCRSTSDSAALAFGMS
eukprot:scaffold56665_cov35-Tisochrysis_lutea.AAC.1